MLAAGVYVPPAARARQAETSLDAAVTRRVKGLLNRLAEVNLQGIASEATALMQQAGRRQVGDAITDELLQVRLQRCCSAQDKAQELSMASNTSIGSWRCCADLH